jgi:hypothetical protein
MPAPDTGRTDGSHENSLVSKSLGQDSCPGPPYYEAGNLNATLQHLVLSPR